MKKIIYLIGLVIICFIGYLYYQQYYKIPTVNSLTSIKVENKKEDIKIYVYDKKELGVISKTVTVENKEDLNIYKLVNLVLENSNALTKTMKVKSLYNFTEDSRSVLLVKFNNEMFQFSTTEGYNKLKDAIMKTLNDYVKIDRYIFEVEI